VAIFPARGASCKLLNLFLVSNPNYVDDFHHIAVATEEFPVLLAPSDSMLPLKEFDRKFWWNIPLGRYGYLKLKHCFLPMA
jgi:hypothetical protein